MPSSEYDGFVKKAVRDDSYRVTVAYVCTICKKLVPAGKSGGGHAHMAKKNLDKVERVKQQRRESAWRLKERKRLLNLC
jgi:hypothetical protein